MYNIMYKDREEEVTRNLNTPAKQNTTDHCGGHKFLSAGMIKASKIYP